MSNTSQIIGLKELRERTERYITRIRRGESFLVVRRSRPVFKISPPEEEDRALLKLAEESFTFWDNCDDAIYDRL
ncbi:MAG: hypothetical protein AAB539_02655 [Patescibacteria group bacterium]